MGNRRGTKHFRVPIKCCVREVPLFHPFCLIHGCYNATMPSDQGKTKSITSEPPKVPPVALGLFDDGRLYSPPWRSDYRIVAN